MLEIYNAKQQKVGAFNNYKQLFRSIQKIERLKLLKGDYPAGQSTWLFEYRSYERLFMVYSHLGGKTPTALERKAYDQQRDIIEIYKGEYAFPVQLIVTPKLDVSALRKQWCKEYCEAHGLSIGQIRESTLLAAAA